MKLIQKCPYCGGEAWEWTRLMAGGEMILEGDIMYFNGYKPKKLSSMDCQRCGMNIPNGFFEQTEVTKGGE